MQKVFAYLNILTLPSWLSGKRVGRSAQARRLHFRPSAARTAAASRRAGGLRGLLSTRTPWQVWVGYGLVSVNIALVLADIIGVNYYAAEGYVLRELQTKVATLNEQNKKLIVKTTEVGSVVQLQEDLASSGYVSAGTSEFIQATQLTQR